MDDFYRFAKRLAKAFACEGLDYAFTGALAVSFYGAPRTTTDIDVMVSVADDPEAKHKLVEALQQAGLEADERRIEQALTSGYNIATFKDKGSPYTVDVILSNKKLEKQAETIAGIRTFLQKPEGLILAKLKMIKATLPRERAVKDEEDVKAILTFTKVDIEAVKKKAKQDKTFEIFQSLIE